MHQNNIHVLARGVLIDEGSILVCKTLDLPINFYFLPGGHVEHGEAAQDAVIREFIEETESHCSIKRFLGCLEYSFEPGHSSICHNHEYNFVFELQSDDLKVEYPLAQPEDHIALVWMPLAELSKIDFRAEPLRELLPQWIAEAPCNSFTSVMRG
jgi:8-oxo-dGTP diphosphatase